MSGESRPIGVGGDWWFARALPDDRVLIAVGDVTGHDVASALVAAMARGAVEGAALALGARVNARRVMDILETSLAGLRGTAREMTCCVAVVDPEIGRIDVAGAGHPFPYVRRAGGFIEVLVARGDPLGSAAPSIGAASTDLAPGDLVLFTTDGLTDCKSPSGHRFGERRLRQLLADHPLEATANASRLRAHIAAALGRFTAGTAVADDVTMVVCELHRYVVGRGSAGVRVEPDTEVAAIVDAIFEEADPTETAPLARWPTSSSRSL